MIISSTAAMGAGQTTLSRGYSYSKMKDWNGEMKRKK